MSQPASSSSARPAWASPSRNEPGVASSLGAIDTWEARIANRDFNGAEQVLDELDTDESDIGVYLSDQAVSQIITYWFLRYEDRLSELLPAARAFLERSRESDGDFMNYGTYLIIALIDAAEGRTEEAEKNVQRLLRDARQDMTNYSEEADQACKILGMAGATEEAVDCLREAFSKPSFAFPFLEPYLPYYDPIRNEPAFVELLAEGQ